MERRSFFKVTGTAAAVVSAPMSLQGAPVRKIGFPGANSLVYPSGWETLNPGCWQVINGSLRRRIKNYGDRARATGSPYHYETHKKGGDGKMPVDYDPSLAPGDQIMIAAQDGKSADAKLITSQRQRQRAAGPNIAVPG